MPKRLLVGPPTLQGPGKRSQLYIPITTAFLEVLHYKWQNSNFTCWGNKIVYHLNEIKVDHYTSTAKQKYVDMYEWVWKSTPESKSDKGNLTQGLSTNSMCLTWSVIEDWQSVLWTMYECIVVCTQCSAVYNNLNFNNISQYYYLYCNVHQINAALVRDFF